MSFFNPTPEERANKERKKAEKEQQRLDKRFAASPAGKARAARVAGMKIFQIDVPLSYTSARTVAMAGAYADSSETRDYSYVIQSIEEEGWHLEHAGYVFRLTGTKSRDRFFASGHQEAASGEIVGIYLFRAAEAP